MMRLDVQYMRFDPWKGYVTLVDVLETRYDIWKGCVGMLDVQEMF